MRTMDKKSGLLIVSSPSNQKHWPPAGRAWIDVRERANTRAVHSVLEKILAVTPNRRVLRLIRFVPSGAVARRSRLVAPGCTGEDTFDAGRVKCNLRAYLQGSVARMKETPPWRKSPLLSARAQQEESGSRTA